MQLHHQRPTLRLERHPSTRRRLQTRDVQFVSVNTLSSIRTASQCICEAPLDQRIEVRCDDQIAMTRDQQTTQDSMPKTRTRSSEQVLQIPFARRLIRHDQFKGRGVVAVTAQRGHAVATIEIAVHPLKGRWIRIIEVLPNKLLLNGITLTQQPIPHSRSRRHTRRSRDTGTKKPPQRRPLSRPNRNKIGRLMHPHASAHQLF